MYLWWHFNKSIHKDKTWETLIYFSSKTQGENKQSLGIGTIITKIMYSEPKLEMT